MLAALVPFAVLCLVVLRSWTRSSTTGPLNLANGTRFERARVPENAPPDTERFMDGSTLRVHGGGEVVSLASTDRDVVLLLQRGKVELEVVPGGPRHWTVEVGLGRVEVVGTKFSVERQPERVSVQVQRGKVLVRSTLLDDGVRMAGPGDRVLLEAQRRKTQSTPSATVAPIAPPAAREPVSITPSAPSVPTVERAVNVVAGLLREADQARLDRDFEYADRLLGRIVDEHPSDARAALSSYSRGVLQLRQLRQPGLAAASFERALALGASRSLRQDCYLGWVEAALGLGQRQHAEELFARYLDEFPKGRHRQEMTRLLGREPARRE
jgi:TolA-binding protein